MDEADVMIVGGLVMFGIGVGAYDWRLALVLCGIIVMALGLVGALAGAGSDGVDEADE